jgi:hypothetical protein
MSFWKKVSAPLLMLGLASPVLANCDALGGLVPGADCPALKDGNFANLKLEGNAEATAKFKGLLEAVYSLDKLAVEMEGNLIASCGELGAAIGMPEAETKAEAGGGEGAKKVCEAVAAKVGGILKANAEAKLTLEVGEPSCKADIKALTDCFAGCGAVIQPGEFKAACEGGEISGKCSGECKGKCTAEAGANCSGKCGGACKGKCDGKATEGEAGASCAGKCEGECTASCEMEASGSCEGSCSGECSVELEAPSCSGTFKPPSVDPSCHMQCTAKTAASVKCEPPSVSIKVDGKGSADVEKLVAGLQVALPKIFAMWKGSAERAVGIAKGIVEGVAELPQIAQSFAGTAAIQAATCAAMAVEMAGSASASLSVNVEASASVGGSVGSS